MTVLEEPVNAVADDTAAADRSDAPPQVDFDTEPGALPALAVLRRR